MHQPLLARRPQLLRALTEAFVPAAAELDAVDFTRVLERADSTLAGRPEPLRRQLQLALTTLALLGAVRFARPLHRVPVARRGAFLDRLQNAPVLKLRLAVWGIRTLVFAGYYGDPQRHAEIGYHPRREGWSALETPGEAHEAD